MVNKMYKSEFLQILYERGFINQCTNQEGLDVLLSKEKVTGYIGFDCTAKSLHVGNLVQLMMLRWFQKCGHAPIILFGDATTRIGDPSGKDKARQLLSIPDIEKNKTSISQVINKFLDEGRAQLTSNADWLLKINYIDFLRDYGKLFSINRMLAFESVKLRLEREQSLSFLEFNYMLLQAYDFLHLYNTKDCLLQLGGSDQWGNIICGIELIKKIHTKEAFGITAPLITTASGAKMGKSEKGAIWLNADMLSSYEYWQFWRNIEDADVERFLKLFTELPLSEIERLSKLKDKEINEAKIILANEATKLCHGQEAANNAMLTSQYTFVQGDLGAELPVITITKDELLQGIEAFKLFVIAGLAESNTLSRKLINGKGARINNEIINDPMAIIDESYLSDGKMKLSSGKKKHLIVKISD